MRPAAQPGQVHGGQAAARLPSAPGVCRFCDARQRVLYIGRASNLRRRVASYWSGATDPRHLSRMVTAVARIEAVACDSEHEAAWLERNLLERELPYWNRTRGGQEVIVYIRLLPQPGSPRLQVVHSRVPSDRARYFGPYLGGLKVRLAVSALHGVTGLAYTSDRLSGCERDMARALGVRPDDLVGLARMVNAVLDRRPKAVRWLRGELIRRRDSAAQAGAFEVAARLQAEIEGVDWVVSEQKVALCDSGDFDIHGWADGLLVRFQVRRGRLCAWEEQACTEAVARPRVAATPGPWREFAGRNAQLAARLRGTPARPALGR